MRSSHRGENALPRREGGTLGRSCAPLEEVALPRAIDRLAAGHNTEFAVDRFEVRLHRVVRDNEVLCHFPARHCRRQVSEDVALARRQSLNQGRKLRLVAEEALCSVYRGSRYAGRTVAIAGRRRRSPAVGGNHDVTVPVLLVRLHGRVCGVCLAYTALWRCDCDSAFAGESVDSAPAAGDVEELNLTHAFGQLGIDDEMIAGGFEPEHRA